MPEDDPRISVPIVYVGLEDTPVLYVNQFVVQHEQDSFFLTCGQLQPPILVGSEEEQKEQAEQMAYVPIHVVARLGLSRRRLVQLIGVLQANLAHFDRKQQGSGDD